MHARTVLVVAAALVTALAGCKKHGPPDVISGTVASDHPEAGVWVIAETTSLPTRFIKIVVTDDNGRFVLPELPKADYDVWVRGYGLDDSAKVKAHGGDADLKLTVKKAASPADAARVYPASSWSALIAPPPPSEFPGTGDAGNGIPPEMKVQEQWTENLTVGCNLCHQVGTAITRQTAHMNHLGFKSSVEAWDYRTETGQRGPEMKGAMKRFGRRGLEVMADWTDRIAKGEVPEAPPRPTGVERNIVVTMWDVGKETTFAHGSYASHKPDPTVNGGGPVYVVDSGDGNIISLDPKTSTEKDIPIATKANGPWRGSITKPSNFWGEKVLWKNPADPHDFMLDDKARLWMTSQTRNPPASAFCYDGSTPFSKYFPLPNNDKLKRQASRYDPKTGTFDLFDTCFYTHHLQFDDQHKNLYFSGATEVIPWIDTKKYDETKDDKASQGWCPLVLDTNGDGKITKPWNEPRPYTQNNSWPAGYFDEGSGTYDKFDPKLDTRVSMRSGNNLLGSYTVMPSPKDGSLWAAGFLYPGTLFRLDPGSAPPETCVAERYVMPPEAHTYGGRGVDVDKDGVVWLAVGGRASLASFDRRKCKVTSGPATLDGTQCPEGWTFFSSGGPTFKGTDLIADMHYGIFVDQHDTFGLGDDVPFVNGTNSDSLLGYVPQSKQWVRLRVPYPLGFYQRVIDGRIDDKGAGWKGRGLWSNYGTNAQWHTEGGPGTLGKVVHFQLRPDPLAH